VFFSGARISFDAHLSPVYPMTKRYKLNSAVKLCEKSLVGCIMDNNLIESTLLEEYKTLREELLLHIRVINQILISSGTLAFVALTFLIKIDVAYDVCGIVLLLLLIPLFFKYRDEVFSIARIATYIEKRIEQRVEGLNWTTQYNRACAAQPSCFRFHRYLTRTLPHAEVCYFMILLVMTWLLPIYLNESFYSWSTTLIMGLLSAIYVYNYLILRKYRKYRQTWEKTWETSTSDRA